MSNSIEQITELFQEAEASEKDKHTKTQCQEFISDLQSLIETTIDTLIEVGNGVSDKDLHALANQWIAFRDLFNTVTDK